MLGHRKLTIELDNFDSDLTRSDTVFSVIVMSDRLIDSLIPYLDRIELMVETKELCLFKVAKYVINLP